MSTINPDPEQQFAPPRPWPFPPVHVMPTAPNGTEKGYHHCIRCGKTLKIDKQLGSPAGCPKIETKGGPATNRGSAFRGRS